jgi:hypothetical protein
MTAKLGEEPMPSNADLVAQRAEEQAEFMKQVELQPMPEMTSEQIAQSQGTRKSDKAPWESYSDQLTEQLDPELEAAIAEFAARDPHEHTDSQTQEELCRVREENEALAKEYQWLSPDEYADEKARIGRIMHSSELITKLREECGLTAIYREHPLPKRKTLLVDNTNGIKGLEVACWVQFGYMPEFSICNFDEHGVILQEAYRGWRTVLLQLLIKRLLTEETITRVFGEAVGPAARKYLEILQGFRTTQV